MRSGITPVVAVVILLMMTVAGAGSAYTFITTTTQQAQEETDTALSTSVAVRDADCFTSGVRLALVNTGNRRIAGSSADVLVYSGGSLVADATVDVSGKGFLSPGGFDRVATNLSGMAAREAHRVELSIGTDRVGASTTCEAAHPRSCSEILDAGIGTGNGTYTVAPGGAGPLEAYCDMDTAGGGWFKLRIANDCNNDNMFWFSKYNGIDDQESVHGPIGDQFNWSYLAHLDNQSDLVGGTCDNSTNQEGFDWVFTGGPFEESVTWHEWGNASNVYSDREMDGIRSVVSEIAETTEAFSHTNDDDGCDPNGEWFLKQAATGAGSDPRYQISHFTSGNQESAYAIETVGEMANYTDVGYLVPSYLDRFNEGGGCSGEVDHASFGFERNYTLVR